MGQVGNRLSDLFETMENELYKKCFKDDIDKEIVSLADINDFFFKQKLVVEGAMKCMVSIDIETELDKNGDSDKYVIRQIILDAEGKPIKKTANSYYGRTLRCAKVSIDLMKEMDGNQKIIIE